MEIIYRKGDLLASDEDVILHGCNAQGVMGSGIAKQIRERYPLTYEFYRECFVDGKLSMGVVLVDYDQDDDRYILHGITQEHYGTNKGTRYCDYEAIRQVMKEVERLSRYFFSSRIEDTILVVGMPKIGAGLANGDWKVISKIIEEESKSWQPVVYELE